MALQRGPLIYCVEAVDHDGRDVRTAILRPAEPIDVTWQPDLLGGVSALTVPALFAGAESGWSGGALWRNRAG